MRDQRGFTLLELLIAITLLAGIVVILAAGFNLSLRAWEAGEKRIENHYSVTEAIMLVIRQLKISRRSYTFDEKTYKRKIAFEGNASSVTFVTATPRFHSGGKFAGLYQQRISYDSSSKNILFKEGFFDRRRPLVNDFEGLELAVGDGKIESFSMEYYIRNPQYHPSRKNEQDEYIWVGAVNYPGEPVTEDEENDPQFFPRAVRISLQAAGNEKEEDNERFRWPRILVPLYRGIDIKLVERRQ